MLNYDLIYLLVNNFCSIVGLDTTLGSCFDFLTGIDTFFVDIFNILVKSFADFPFGNG